MRPDWLDERRRDDASSAASDVRRGCIVCFHVLIMEDAFSFSFCDMPEAGEATWESDRLVAGYPRGDANGDNDSLEYAECESS